MNKHAILWNMEPIEIREFRNRIGRAIRELREEEGISAHYLAKVIGVTQSTVSRIENGTTSISAEKLCFLAKVYNRSLSYFVGEKSPISYDEDDILRAGLVFYGASHLKAKRTISVTEYYRTYADFLNAALKSVDDARFAAALATTLYQQAIKNKLDLNRIITTIQNKRLLSNLRRILLILIGSEFRINRPVSEKEKVNNKLNKLLSELESEYRTDLTKDLVAEVSSDYVARFINASLNYE